MDFMNTITAKLIDVVDYLIDSNEKDFNEHQGIYTNGYQNGYHDALVEVLNQMHIKNDYQYYDE